MKSHMPAEYRFRALTAIKATHTLVRALFAGTAFALVRWLLTSG
jgi:hypothetical protein